MNITDLTTAQFSGKEAIPGGSLYLRSVTSIPEGFNPTVSGWLDLSSVTSIPEGFNPTVSGSLDLSSVTSIPEGFNPTVSGSLYLRSVTSIPEGFNPTVGEGLYLSSVTSIPEGFNPTVGGWLDLRSVTSIPEGFNPTVGGWLDLGSVTSKDRPKTNRPPAVITWQDGRFACADGILMEVTSHRGNVWRGHNVGSKTPLYLVVDGDKCAHGSTLAEARADLVYKISQRDTSEYKGLKLSHQMTFAEGVECYRVITGACAAGVRAFVEQHWPAKKGCTIKQIIDMTKGQYGHETFKAFWK